MAIDSHIIRHESSGRGTICLKKGFSFGKMGYRTENLEILSYKELKFGRKMGFWSGEIRKKWPNVWLKIKNFRKLGSSEREHNATGGLINSSERREKGVLTAGHAHNALSGEARA